MGIVAAAVGVTLDLSASTAVPCGWPIGAPMTLSCGQMAFMHLGKS